MLDFGETRPASGYEHHVSHFWEMKLLREGRHSVFHGAKVGVGVLASAAVARTGCGSLSRDEVSERLPSRPAARPSGRRGGHPGGLRRQAEPGDRDQQPFLEMTGAEHRRS